MRLTNGNALRVGRHLRPQPSDGRVHHRTSCSRADAYESEARHPEQAISPRPPNPPLPNPVPLHLISFSTTVATGLPGEPRQHVTVTFPPTVLSACQSLCHPRDTQRPRSSRLPLQRQRPPLSCVCAHFSRSTSSAHALPRSVPLSAPSGRGPRTKVKEQKKVWGRRSGRWASSMPRWTGSAPGLTECCG